VPRWFTRPDPATEQVAGSTRAAVEEPDSLPALERHLAAVVTEVNAASGALPTEAVVLARRVTDLAAEALRRADAEGVQGQGSIHARVALHAVLTDYLPTTVRRYLAARRAAADPAVLTGPLVEQLTTLHDAVRESVTALHDDDLMALEVQGIFLRDRFTGSDL
jgi:hypothetical protein